MLPSKHIIVSLPLGAIVWGFTQSALAGLLCAISGVLIDVDHLLDYIIHYGLKGFDFRKFYRNCKKMANPVEAGGVKRLYLLFHAIEIAILLWAGLLITKNIYLLAITLGYTAHLVMDVSANKMKPFAYFLSLRMLKGFNTARFVKQHQS